MIKRKDYKQLTIYSEVLPLPSQKQKADEAKKALVGEVINIESEKMLVDLLTEFAYSPSVFTDKRCKDNFTHCDYIVLDIDEGHTIKGVVEILKSLRIQAYIGTTTNHQKEKKDVRCDRFRLIFPLESRIKDIEQFYATYEYLGQYIKFDNACKDVARFYFACKALAKVEGAPLRVRTERLIKEYKKSNVKPVEGVKGKLSKRTVEFLEVGASNWHEEFLLACRDLKAQQYTIEEAEDLLSSITGELDEKHDLHQLRYVYNDNSVEFDYREEVSDE